MRTVSNVANVMLNPLSWQGKTLPGFALSDCLEHRSTIR